ASHISGVLASSPLRVLGLLPTDTSGASPGPDYSAEQLLSAPDKSIILAANDAWGDINETLRKLEHNHKPGHNGFDAIAAIVSTDLPHDPMDKQELLEIT